MVVINRQSTSVLCCALVLLFHTTLEQLVPPLSSRTERFALIQLRSSLGLRTREWPIRSDPCLIWAGIQCQNGRVVGINISGFKRTRIGSQNPQFAVDSLGNFTLLVSFNASKFSLPGSIPDWFGQRLKSLQVLDLRSCSISGDIPYDLGNLTNITSLHLSDNSLSGIIPTSLGQLSRLSVLDLSHNSLTGSIPPDIGTLSNLQFLNLSSNNLSSSIPAQLGDLSSLVDLDLSFNLLSGSLPLDFRGLRNLQKMVIGNNLLAGSLPGNLFPPLTQLQFVVLKHNDFTGDLPDALWSMSELRFLDASGNNFTGALPALSSNANGTTVVFNLSQNMFYGGLTSIPRRFSLIDLSGNYIQGKVPDNARSNTYYDGNCLQNVSSRRTLIDCASFYAARGLIFDNFGLPNSTQPPPRTPAGKKRRTWIILVGVLGGVGLIALVVIVLVILIVCNRKRSETNQTGVGVGPVPTSGSPPPANVSLNFSSLGDAYTYQQILQATSDFNDVNFIKNGHSGDLFRGIIEGGIHVVIKKIDIRSVKKETFMLESDFFSKISHARLVPFLGHCLENENEKFLIYKYMPNGDLSSSLYRKNNTEDDSLQSLDWITRLKIAIGTAVGLSYLHHECTPPLVHRDIQASSILLDDKFEVRLGSLNEVCTQEEDAHQNMITRLLRLPQTSEQGASGSSMATCAYDVYCFGKVLLELVTGKLGISASSDATTNSLEEILPYISIHDKELVTNIVDRSLIIDEDLLEEVWSMAIVARSCLEPKPSRRPLMRYVLKALENPLKVVREEHTSSARLRTTSSRGSWNAAFFGSWRHSSSDVAAVQMGPTNKAEGGSSYKQSGTTGSHGSGHSSSNRRQSNEIFPEPFDGRDSERER